MNVAQWREDLQSRLLSALAGGDAPWLQPWKGEGLPYNPVSQKAGAEKGTYHGINAVALLMDSLTNGGDPRFVTFIQAQKEGWKVKKGAKSVQILKMATLESQEEKKARMIAKKEGKPYAPKKKPQLVPMLYHVFNASQIDGIPPFSPSDRASIEPEKISDAMKRLNLRVERGEKSFFDPSTNILYCKEDPLTQKGASEVLLLALEATGEKDRAGWNSSRVSPAAKDIVLGFSSMFLSRIAGVDLSGDVFLKKCSSTKEMFQSAEEVGILKSISLAQHAVDYLVTNTGLFLATPEEKTVEDSEEISLAAGGEDR